MGKRFIVCALLLGLFASAATAQTGMIDERTSDERAYLSFLFGGDASVWGGPWRDFTLPHATSKVPADQWGDYSAASALDGNLATSWAEGVKGPGIGEKIAFPLGIESEVIRVFPGYGADGTFQRNHRVKRALVTVHGIIQDPGEPFTSILYGGLKFRREVTFADRMELQEIDLGTASRAAGPGERFVGVIEILDVYRGSRYDDACIAEIQSGWKESTAALARAIDAGDLREAGRLLGSGASAIFRYPDGDTSLVRAVKKGQAALTRLLLERGGAPNLTTSKDGTSPLQIAAAVGNAEIMRLLVEAGADPNYAPSGGYPPLHLALRHVPAAEVDFLLGRGADPNLRGGFNGLTALHVLVGAGEDPDSSGARWDEAAFTALVRAGADLNARTATPSRGAPSENDTALTMAVRERKSGFVRRLLEAGADVDAPSEFGFSPLMLAVMGHEPPADMEPIMKILLAHGADPNRTTGGAFGEWDGTALKLARERKRWDVVALLGGSESIAAYAAFQGDIAALEHVLVRNKNDRDVPEALAWAAAAGHLAVVKALVEKHGADIDRGAPLVQAIGNAHWDVVEYLLERGADFRAPGRLKFTWAGPLAEDNESKLEYTPTSIIFRENYMEVPFQVEKNFSGNPVRIGAILTGQRVTGIEIRGTYAYLGITGVGLVIVDLSKPEAPREVGRLRLDMNLGDIDPVPYLHGDTLYMHVGDRVHSVDVRFPTDPALLATFRCSSMNCMAAWGRFLAMAEGKGAIVFDVADPRKPVPTKFSVDFGTRVQGMASTGDRIYFSLQDRIEVFTASETGKLMPAGTFTNGEYPHADRMEVSGDHLLLVDRGGYGVRVMDRRDGWLFPHPYTGPADAADADRDRLVIGHGGTLQVFDLTRPATLVQAGYLQEDAGDWNWGEPILDIALIGGYAYAAHGAKGLVVYRLP